MGTWSMAVCADQVTSHSLQEGSLHQVGPSSLPRSVAFAPRHYMGEGAVDQQIREWRLPVGSPPQRIMQ